MFYLVSKNRCELQNTEVLQWRLQNYEEIRVQIPDRWKIKFEVIVKYSCLWDTGIIRESQLSVRGSLAEQLNSLQLWRLIQKEEEQLEQFIRSIKLYFYPAALHSHRKTSCLEELQTGLRLRFPRTKIKLNCVLCSHTTLCFPATPVPAAHRAHPALSGPRSAATILPFTCSRVQKDKHGEVKTPKAIMIYDANEEVKLATKATVVFMEDKCLKTNFGFFWIFFLNSLNTGVRTGVGKLLFSLLTEQHWGKSFCCTPKWQF